MRVAVASGKGGTGKTLVSTSLAWLLARDGHSIAYVDADVEEPNGHLFLHPELLPVQRHRRPARPHHALSRAVQQLRGLRPGLR